MGKFRQPIGDLNRRHHALQNEYPLVYQRFLGEDGLSGSGCRSTPRCRRSRAGRRSGCRARRQEASRSTATAPVHAPLARLQNFWQLSRSTYTMVFTATGGIHDDGDLRSRPGRGFSPDLPTVQAGTPARHPPRRGLSAPRHRGRIWHDRYGAFLDLNAHQPSLDLRRRYDYAERPVGWRTRNGG